MVLARDLPKYGLKAGDLGVVVELYEPDGLKVEFVTASGRTQAVVALKERDVRKIAPEDMISVRRLQKETEVDRVCTVPPWASVRRPC